MSRRSQSDVRRFLTVILWPPDFTREQTADLVADAARMDREAVRLMLGQAPPRIVGLVDEPVAQAAVAALVREGGEAFAPSLSDIAALGPTLKIKDLRIDEGSLIVNLWRGPSTRIECSDVEIVVRARLHSETKRPWSDDGGPMISYMPGCSGAGAASSYWIGAYGAAGAIAAAYVAEDQLSGARWDTSISVSNKLDLHTSDGRVFQIDADKFGFQVLGDLRGHSDNQNTDALCELLVKLNPDVIVDPYFSLWKLPVGHTQLRLPQMLVNNDDPAFAFYSRWSALMYRHMTRPSACADNDDDRCDLGA